MYSCMISASVSLVSLHTISFFQMLILRFQMSQHCLQLYLRSPHQTLSLPPLQLPQKLTGNI